MEVKSSNPVMGGFQRVSHSKIGSKTMSIEGTSNKTMLLLLIVVLSGFFSWNYISPTFIYPSLIGSVILGLILAIVISFKPLLAKILAPIYAILEGIILGLFSSFFEVIYPGIVIQAVLLTFGVAFLMNILYRNEIIKVTQKFRSVMLLSIGAIFLTYLISMILSFFGTTIPLIHDSGPIGIIFSLIVVTIASLSLLLDFDLIDRQIQAKAHKDMEWYGAFALLVTLVWLYLEILKLLSKLRSRD